MNIDEAATRIVQIGGLTKSELLEKLQADSIELNRYADLLFADDRFTTDETASRLTTVELCPADLGFPEGATMPQIQAAAFERDLRLCPLELGPHMRLQMQDQPEGRSSSANKTHQAPDGSITIVSAPLTEDHEIPKGFYLRNIDGVLWLRGYVADDTHVWNAYDRFIFCR
ncbi:helicase [Saccharibacillus sp. O23]|uniref:helicase n=1 Tax=Saccharibacillus sp. O23 TaxID=2009338 RepID=UPI000B4DFABA|nr:helicase [Saccharibacillus sp. O23]OWR27259.1 helicase [Saccharibacillus sp. O23]